MSSSEAASYVQPLFEMRVIQSASPLREPKLKVRSDVPMTPAGRAAMNAWLLEQFGDQEVAYIMDMSVLRGYFDREINKAFGIPERMLLGSSLTLDKLRAACKLVSP